MASEIPTEVAPTPVALPKISPEIAGAGEAGAAKIGEAAAAVADYGFGVERLIQNAQRTVALMQAETLIGVDKDKALENLSTQTDYTTMNQSMASHIEDLKKKYSDMYGNDPAIWSKVEPHLDSQLEDLRHVAAVKSLDLLNKHGVALLDKAGEDAALKWAEAVTPDEKEMAQNEYFMKLAIGQRDHLITEEQGLKRQNDFLKKREEAEIVLGVKSNDPNAIQAALDKMSQPGSYKYIDPKELANYQMFGENRLERVQEKQERQTDAVQVTNIYRMLKQKYTHTDGTTDYDAMVRANNDTDFQVSHNLSMKQVGLIDAEINREEAEFRRTQENKWQKTAIDNISKLTTHKLSVPEVVRQAQAGEISPQIEEHFIQEIKSGKDAETSPVHYIDLLDRILNGEDVSKEIHRSLGSTLSASHAGQLLELNMKERKGYTQDPWFKLTTDEFKSAFGVAEEAPEDRIKRELAGGAAKPKKDEARYVEGMSQLMEKIEAGYPSGGAKKGRLQGEDIFKAGEEILKALSVGKAAQPHGTNKPTGSEQTRPQQKIGRFTVQEVD